MRKVLGIDQSYTSCGYVVYDSETKDVLAFGTLKTTDKTGSVYARALQVAEKIDELIVTHQPNVVHMEGLAFGISGNATRDLAGLMFTIRTIISLRHSNIPVHEFAPTSVKKHATGSGKADKKAMVSALPDHILKKITDANFKKTTGLTDITDAYWIATMPVV